MTKEDLLGQVTREVETAPENRVSPEAALTPETAGMQIYEAPLVCCAAADDPMFTSFLTEAAVGPQLLLPEQWLPGARTVISFFLPNTAPVKAANAAQGADIPPEWLHARVEGQAFVLKLCRLIAGALEAEGWQAVIPAADPRFRAVEKPRADGPFGAETGFTSNWSERHVAFACGLGTFGLSKGIITEKGMCGRLGSVITNAPLAPDRRDYTGLYDNCIMCGSCVPRCPVSAITLEEGKRHVPCCEFLDETKVTYAPRYGCGKCQVAVPCESRNPRRDRPAV